MHELNGLKYIFNSSILIGLDLLKTSLENVILGLRFYLLGLLFSRISNHTIALKYYIKAKNLMIYKCDIFIYNKIIARIAQTYYITGFQEESVSMFKKLELNSLNNDNMQNCEMQLILNGALGIDSENKMRYEDSLKYFSNALSYAYKLDSIENICVTSNNLGNVLNDLEKYEESLNVYFKLYNYSIVHGDLVGKVLSMIGRASVLSRMNNINEALILLNEAQSLAEEIGYVEMSEIATTNAGILLIDNTDRIQHGIDLLRSALLLSRITNQKINSGYIYHGLARGYVKLKDKNSSLYFINKALNILKNSNDYYGLLYCYNLKMVINIDFYFNYSNAIKLGIRAENLFIKYNLPHSDIYRNILYNISLSYYKLEKNSCSLIYLEKAIHLDLFYKNEENMKKNMFLMNKICNYTLDNI